MAARETAVAVGTATVVAVAALDMVPAVLVRFEATAAQAAVLDLAVAVVATALVMKQRVMVPLEESPVGRTLEKD